MRVELPAEQLSVGGQTLDLAGVADGSSITGTHELPSFFPLNGLIAVRSFCRFQSGIATRLRTVSFHRRIGLEYSIGGSNSSRVRMRDALILAERRDER